MKPLLGLIALLFVGCVSAPKPVVPFFQEQPTPNTEAPQLIGSWQLHLLKGRVVSDPALILDMRADGTFSGRSPCNNYGGRYAAGADFSFMIQEFITTEAACTDPARQRVEADLYRALDEATKFRASIKGGDIRFLKPGGLSTVFVTPKP